MDRPKRGWSEVLLWDLNAGFAGVGEGIQTLWRRFIWREDRFQTYSTALGAMRTKVRNAAKRMAGWMVKR